MAESQPPKEKVLTLQEAIWRAVMAIGLVALAFVALLAAQAV